MTLAQIGGNQHQILSSEPERAPLLQQISYLQLRRYFYHLRLAMQFGNGIQGRTQRLAEEVSIAKQERLVQECCRFLQPLLHPHPCTLQLDNLHQQDSSFISE